jgi:hypothetical protein
MRWWEENYVGALVQRNPPTSKKNGGSRPC